MATYRVLPPTELAPDDSAPPLSPTDAAQSCASLPDPLVAWLDGSIRRVCEVRRGRGPWPWCVMVKDENGEGVDCLGPSLYVAACRAGHAFVPSLPSFKELDR